MLPIAQKIKEKFYGGLAYLFFDRNRSLLVCSAFVTLSLVVEMRFGLVNFFSCSGAVVSIAGLFLNIKYSLHFHLKTPKLRLYNKLIGGAILGSSTLSEEQEAWVNSVLTDEIYGVSFMVVGTLIWAYGTYMLHGFK